MHCNMPEKTSTFVSFDYDNDAILKTFLVSQSKLEDTPFFIKDASIKEAIPSGWKEKARQRIKSCDVVIVICGEKTHTADGVSVEVKIAQEEGKPYFLLKGYSSKVCTKPASAKTTDKMYTWSWDILKQLIHGDR